MIELSVVIATHNRHELLRRCLVSLAAQTQDPATFEAIVADDGSTDGTAEMVEALETPFPLRLLRLPKSGHAAAQNEALAVAQAPACLLLDDDIVASPELVEAHVAVHRDNADAIGIGAMTLKPPEAPDWYARSVAKGWAEHYEELERRPARWSDCYGANLSFPRRKLEEVGGISTEVPAAKDFELALRLCRAGCVPTYAPRAHGVHDDQKRSPRMLVEARRHGQMHVELSRRFPEAEAELLDWTAGGAGPRELQLRRICLALHVPVSPLARLGALVPGEGRKMIWHHFVRRLAFWRGVRERVNRPRWRELTHPSPAGERA
jgi:GT2 family glycosyltransferase